MDPVRFDAVVHRFGVRAGRRATVKSLVGGLLAGRGLAAWDETAAKKKKKKKKKQCKPPTTRCGKTGCCAPGQVCRDNACEGICTFAETATTLTLQGDCVSRSSINIPAGKTLDGGGHTIFLRGTNLGTRYGVGAQGGEAHVTNLTIDGSGLTAPAPICTSRGVGIQFQDAFGTITDCEITGLSQVCGFGILVNVFGGSSPARTVNIDNVAISDAQAGIVSSGINKLTLGITECAIQDVGFGIQVQYNVEAAISDNEITATTYGVVLTAQENGSAAPNVTATENTVTGAVLGMSVQSFTTSTGTPTLTATGNTIVGPGPVSNQTHGISFFRNAAGSVSGNEISNFFDNSAVGCGIFVADNAGTVSIGSNTFPNPPGNEQDVCDNP